VLFLLTILVFALLLPSIAGTSLLERAPDAVLERWSRLAPGDPRPHVILGERRLAQGEPRDALERFARAASLGSQEFRLAVALADATRAAGLHEKALAQARELLRVDPASGRLHRILGQCLLEMGELSEGIAALEEATRRAPREPDTWVALAEAHLGIEGFQPRGARVWEAGRRQNPDAPILAHGLAECYTGLGRYEEAEALLHRLPEEPLPEHPKARELYARAWAARGAVLRRLRPDPARRAQARQALERGLALAPRHPETHYELGLARADDGDWEGAREALDTATRLRPYAHPFWYHLARVERRLGHEKEAARAQARFDLLVASFATVNRESRALDARPDDLPRRLRLARLLIDRWDWDAAALHLSLILRDQPRHPEAMRLLERVQVARSQSGEARNGS
jgi:tetratricopeptide (TPR) repeat protein